jgi:hypothetical protein
MGVRFVVERICEVKGSNMEASRWSSRTAEVGFSV